MIFQNLGIEVQSFVLVDQSLGIEVQSLILKSQILTERLFKLSIIALRKSGTRNGKNVSASTFIVNL